MLFLFSLQVSFTNQDLDDRPVASAVGGRFPYLRNSERLAYFGSSGLCGSIG